MITFSKWGVLCPIAQLFDTMYHISTISDTLRQGVDSLAQWLEHWISTPAIRVRIPSGTWDFFQAMHHFLVTNFHIRKKMKILKNKLIILFFFC